MARGRLITKDVSYSKRLAALKTDSARMLWDWILPHLDVDGRYYADPVLIKSQIVPRLETWDSEKIENCLQDLAHVQAITLYHGPDGDGDRYLAYYKFDEKQGHRKDREAKSKIPAPPKITSKTTSKTTTIPELLRETPELLRETPELLQPRDSKKDLKDEFDKPPENHNSGVTPEQLRSNSRVTPRNSGVTLELPGVTPDKWQRKSENDEQDIGFKEEIDAALNLLRSNSGVTPRNSGVTPGLYLYLYLYTLKDIPHMKRKLIREKYGLDEGFFSLWKKDFKTYRQRIKRTLTPKGEVILLGSLAELIEKKKGTAKLIIEQTIASGKWPGFHPVPGYEPPSKLIQSSTPLPSPAERPDPEETKKYSREVLNALNKRKQDKEKPKKPKGRKALFEKTGVTHE